MKQSFFCLVIAMLSLTQTNAQTKGDTLPNQSRLFLDVHYLPSGTVKFDDVAAAHVKDLAVQAKYGVQFLKYWVDESKGIVYCLSSANDTSKIRETHREAHGLMPQEIYPVTDGIAALPKGDKTYFLDVHNLGAGKVTAADVAKAHEKDLAVQKKHGVNFINYWVDEKKGVVICLSQASDSAQVVQTHKEAHGLVPDYIAPVKQGQ
jgi:phenolic acid decarboxylase